MELRRRSRQEVTGLAKKTEKEAYDTWEKKQSERHRQRQADPDYQEIIKKLWSIGAELSKARSQRKCIRLRIPNDVPISTSDQRIKELKILDAQIKTLTQKKTLLEREWKETYGPVDPVLENISDDELTILCDLEPESDVDPFCDIWVVELVLWAWKDPFLRVGENLKEVNFLNKINWDAYVDDKGLTRFRIKTDNPREVIKERLITKLDILKDSGAITFRRSGNPSVRIIGSLYPREEKGLIVEVNPFAPKGRIVKAVIEALESYGTIFTRKDMFDLERAKALKLRKGGKNLKEIAFALWPKQFEQEEKRISKKINVSGKERASYEQFVNACVDQGKSLGQAYREADKKFHLKGKIPTNRLIVKAYRLLK